MASFLYRARIARQVGLYDETLTGAEDWDMWLRMLEVCDAKYVDEVQYYYRLHGNSMTHTIPDKVANTSRATLEKLRKRHGNGFNLNIIYPNLRVAPNQSLAQWQARVKLGTLLIDSPFCRPEWTVELLVEALRLYYTPLLHQNLIVLLGRTGNWEIAKFSINEFRAHYPSPELDNLSRIIEKQDLTLINAIPIGHIVDSDLVFKLGRSAN